MKNHFWTCRQPFLSLGRDWCRFHRSLLPTSLHICSVSAKRGAYRLLLGYVLISEPCCLCRETSHFWGHLKLNRCCVPKRMKPFRAPDRMQWLGESALRPTEVRVWCQWAVCLLTRWAERYWAGRCHSEGGPSTSCSSKTHADGHEAHFRIMVVIPIWICISKASHLPVGIRRSKAALYWHKILDLLSLSRSNCYFSRRSQSCP